jgi:hypothetical protein
MFDESSFFLNVVRYLIRFSFLSIGRFGNGQGQEFAEHFLLEYWRESLAKWVRYKDIKGEEVCFLLRSLLSITLQPFLFYFFIAIQLPKSEPGEKYRGEIQLNIRL